MWGSGMPEFDCETAPILERLQDEIIDFEHYIAPTKGEKHARRWILEEIREIMEGISVVPFGSFKTGLALPDSDIDMNVRLDTDVNIKKFFQGLRRELVARQVCEQDDMITYRTARVPFLRIHVPDLQVSADVTLNGCLDSSFQTSRWLRSFPKAKPLFLVIKHALISVDEGDDGNSNIRVMSSGHGGLASYVLLALIVHYLIIFDADNFMLSQLLYGFLEYYSTFDFESQMITVGIENTIPKTRNMQRQTMHVYEQFDPDNNIARAMRHVYKAKESFAFILERLDDAWGDWEAGFRGGILDAIVVNNHSDAGTRGELYDYNYEPLVRTTNDYFDHESSSYYSDEYTDEYTDDDTDDDTDGYGYENTYVYRYDESSSDDSYYW
ncbi:hypothetical protein BC940DRAFT_313287 [Gongronella butleri]|nr:hypothetical protein BC940DRAFT_313287 [Gongronella butleri]